MLVDGIKGHTGAAMKPLPLDVISVQSQVVYGRVGNNMAVPTLEALGLSMAAVPPVPLGQAVFRMAVPAPLPQGESRMSRRLAAAGPGMENQAGSPTLDTESRGSSD